MLTLIQIKVSTFQFNLAKMQLSPVHKFNITLDEILTQNLKSLLKYHYHSNHLETQFKHERSFTIILHPCISFFDTLQDSGHFYLFSSSRYGTTQSWKSTWAVKRISSTDTGGGTAGITNNKYNQALASDVSVPGMSEVLWTHTDTSGKSLYFN